jgi:mannan endo-1,4-beta-mannosidase
VKGRKRVTKELDFLVKHGISNLRIMAGAEGEGQINGVQRVSPSLQPSQSVFNEQLLEGLDYLLVEMGRRHMKAIIFLSNNWEWTGGFLQYLNWNGLLPDSVLRRKLSWNENRDYVSKFYDCDDCKNAYYKQLKVIVGRQNSISKKMYKDDPALMAWELANEPRPMRPSAIPAYIKWVEAAAALIKSVDSNHLITTGSEGKTGSEDLPTFEAVHRLKNIDYLTIHIWPKNWGWFKDTAIGRDMNAILDNAAKYIDEHASIAALINKPLVIEEFGLPRDQHQFNTGSPTGLRNRFYSLIFTQWKKSFKSGGPIAGCNFWAFSGIGRASGHSVFWKQGDDRLGDPPMEEQGLNSVFNNDSSTWKLISSFSLSK